MPVVPDCTATVADCRCMHGDQTTSVGDRLTILQEVFVVMPLAIPAESPKALVYDDWQARRCPTTNSLFFFPAHTVQFEVRDMKGRVPRLGMSGQLVTIALQQWIRLAMPWRQLSKHLPRPSVRPRSGPTALPRRWTQKKTTASGQREAPPAPGARRTGRARAASAAQTGRRARQRRVPSHDDLHVRCSDYWRRGSPPVLSPVRRDWRHYGQPARAWVAWPCGLRLPYSVPIAARLRA